MLTKQALLAAGLIFLSLQANAIVADGLYFFDLSGWIESSSGTCQMTPKVLLVKGDIATVIGPNSRVLCRNTTFPITSENKSKLHPFNPMKVFYPTRQLEGKKAYMLVLNFDTNPQLFEKLHDSYCLSGALINVSSVLACVFGGRENNSIVKVTKYALKDSINMEDNSSLIVSTSEEGAWPQTPSYRDFADEGQFATVVEERLNSYVVDLSMGFYGSNGVKRALVPKSYFAD